MTKESIIENRLLPYIPFFIVRYEHDITHDGDISKAISDLDYFHNEILSLHEDGGISDKEARDLAQLTNTVITHITDGNHSEERLVKIMGGVVLELESDRLIKMGEEIGERRGVKIGERRGQIAIIEVLKDIGKNKHDASSALMDKFGLSEFDANKIVKEYW